MNNKVIMWVCIFIFSLIGSAIPKLWGDGMLSIASILFTAIGGAFGIWVAYKINTYN